MLEAEDLIQLKCENNLIQAGVVEASRAVARPGRYPQLNSFDRIRQRVGDRVVDLAFRRCLEERGVPHQYSAAPDFLEAKSYDIALGGRRCLPVAQLVCRRSLIRALKHAPENLLRRRVYLPERAAWDVYRDEDLFVFAFLFGLVTRSREAIGQAVLAGEPLHFLYRMPSEWGLPERWAPLETVVLKTDQELPVTLTLHGQDGYQRYRAQAVKLEGHRRTEISTGLFSIGALGIDRLPSGPIGIYNPLVGETLLVAPYQWGNVWVYGIRIVFAGYIRLADFYRQARPANLSEALSANPCLKDESLLALPAAALKPLPGLFQRAEAWAGRE